MAETLTELVAKISTDATELKSGLFEGEKATEASSKRMADSLKKVGVAMAASGAAITAALGLMGKAAIDEEINIKRLATTIENSGTAYDSVKDSLEALIATTQRKTGIADDEQRNILTRLILVTNDYGKALELLPTVLDLAAAGEMDATTAATYLGKAFLELEDGAEEVSVRFGQASLQFKNMEDIQNRVRGSAENLANPLSVLKASIGDVAEAIGANLIPLIKDAVDKIVDVTIKIQDWIKEHPVLAKNLTLIALGLGVMLTTIGGLILILPTLISGITAFGVVLHVALGPIGLISLAIGGLIAEIIWLLANMEKMQHFWDDVWSNIKQITFTAIDAILAGLEKLVGWLPFFGDKITEARNKLAGMIASEEVQRRVRDIQRSLKDIETSVTETTETVKNQFESATEAIEGFNIALSGSKVPLATATQTIGDTTYRTQLFTQAEIDAAKAAGAKIEMLKQQSDEMAEDERGAKKATDAVRKYGNEFETVADQIEELSKATTSWIYPVGGPPQKVSGTYPKNWGQPSAPIRPGQVLAPGVKVLPDGGIINQPTQEMIGEYMENRVIQNNLYLDGSLFAQVISKYFDREYRAQLT